MRVSPSLRKARQSPLVQSASQAAMVENVRSMRGAARATCWGEGDGTSAGRLRGFAFGSAATKLRSTVGMPANARYAENRSLVVPA